MFESADSGGSAAGGDSARSAAVRRLTAAMDELSGLPVDPASTRANLAEAAVLERARSWAPAQQARVLATLEVAEPRDYDPDREHRPSPRATTPQEVALILRVSTASARGRLEVARGLVDHFPLTLAAATDGTVPWWQARHALEETSELSAAARDAVDHELADHARRGRSPARFTTRLRGAILDADPTAAEQGHLRSLADRAVWVDPHPDGTVTVAATMAAEGGGVFLEMADRLADTPLSIPPAGWPVEGRTADQRRSDGMNGLAHAVIAGLDAAPSLDPLAAAHQALAAVLAQAAAPAGSGLAGRAPRVGRRLRRGGQVLVTVSAETLLGISDAPGDLDGYRPISAGYARRLASPPKAGGGCSPTPPAAPSSTSAASATPPPPRSPSTSSPAPTGSAPGPAAPGWPRTSTTPNPGPRAAPPPRATSPASASETTAPATPAGPSSSPPTATPP